MEKKIEDMTNEERVLYQAQEVTRKCKETMENVNKTLRECQQAKEGVKQFEQRYQKFQDDFDDALKNIVGNIAQSYGFKEKHKFKPAAKEMDKNKMEGKLKELLKGKKHIAFLTGAGVSRASGVPTFRGAGGYYQNMDDVIRLLSFQNFIEDKQEVWDFLNKLMQIVIKNKPNVSHKSIEQIRNMKRVKTTIITQNIDGYHCSDINNQQSFIKIRDIFEIHGNGMYSRCYQEECQLNGSMIRIDEKDIIELRMPSCNKCGQVNRPHVLFFDESYDEQWYRRKELFQLVFGQEGEGEGEGEAREGREREGEVDCLFVVGTELTTGLAQAVVNKYLDEEKLVIDINLENRVVKGFNTHFIEGKSEDILQTVQKVLSSLHNQ